MEWTSNIAENILSVKNLLTFSLPKCFGIYTYEYKSAILLHDIALSHITKLEW